MAYPTIPPPKLFFNAYATETKRLDFASQPQESFLRAKYTSMTIAGHLVTQS